MAKPNEKPVNVKKTRNPITGLINVTGEPDSGKTLFALTTGAAPERTVFIDDDVKGRATVQEVMSAGREFGQYHNLVEKAQGLRELDFHAMCLKMIDEIEPGKYDALIWDTWTRFENTFHPAVAANPTRFRQFYSPMGQIKGAEQWQASFDYEASVINDLLKRVPLVILTSHLKKDKDRVRDIAESKKPLIQKSRMRVWLRNNPDGPEPIGLILKRLAKTIPTDNGLEAVSVLPRKMKPCTWKAILSRWDDPIGNRALTDDEKPNEFEMSILDGILTPDQKDALRLAVIQAEREQGELRELEALGKLDEPAWADEARRLRAGDNENKPMSSKAISDKLGVSMAEINRWSNHNA